MAGDRDTQATSPDPQLALEQPRKCQGEGLGRLVGCVVIDLGRCSVEKLIHRRRLSKDEDGMDG